MTTTTVKLSRYCHVYRKENVIAIFHSLHVKTIFVSLEEDADFVNRLVGHSEISLANLNPQQFNFVQQLQSLKMLVENDFEDDKILKDLQQDRTGNIDISIMYLLLTDQCNLACKYCFIEGAIPEGHRFSLMTEETAKAAVDLFIQKAHLCSNPEHKASIIFYGGEPTLNWSTLQSTVRYIRGKIDLGELPSTLEISMVTNGTLLDENKVLFLKENKVQFAISFDGPNGYSDARIFHNGEKSIDNVLHSFELLRSAEVPISVSCTINLYNQKNIRDIAQWLCNEKISSVGFNLQMDVPGKPPVSDDLIDDAIVAMTDCYKLFRDHGIYEDRIGRKVDFFTKGQVYPFDCGGYGGQIVIAPDGQIGLCHAYLGERKYFDHNVHSTDNFNLSAHPHFTEWSRRSPLNMPQCYDCPALGICGGGCARIADIQNGTIWGLDHRFCKHARHTLEWMIWDLYNIVSS